LRIALKKEELVNLIGLKAIDHITHIFNGSYDTIVLRRVNANGTV
jgi:hypothetical protein